MRAGVFAAAFGLAAALPRLIAAESPAPAAETAELDISASGPAALTEDGGAKLGRQSASGAELSVLQRADLGHSAWYAGWGLDAQRFSFSAPAGSPGATGLGVSALQSVAAEFRLEYFETPAPGSPGAGENAGADEAAAMVSVKPGWYFERHPSAACWDIPVDAGTGVPIPGLPSLSGAIGFENARFYHHAVPLAGLVWDPSATVRVEALYPEPAVLVTPRRGLQLRLGGELVGAGFLTDAQPVRTPVEYYAYRLGAGLAWSLKNGLKLSAAVGDELEREFDFFRENRRVRGAAAPYGELGLSWRR